MALLRRYYVLNIIITALGIALYSFKHQDELPGASCYMVITILQMKKLSSDR